MDLSTAYTTLGLSSLISGRQNVILQEIAEKGDENEEAGNESHTF